MTVTPRVLLSLLAALWLPVCHCQFTTFLLERATCCESVTADAPHEDEADCCGKSIDTCCKTNAGHDRHDDSNKNPIAPCHACQCCVTKAPPPSPVSIDLNAVECILPPPSAEVADTRIINDIPSLSLGQPDPPGPPLGAGDRCALISTWVI